MADQHTIAGNGSVYLCFINKKIMEAISIQPATKTHSLKALWSGRVIHWLCVTFLFVDAIMKVARNHYHIDGTTQLGWSEDAVRPLGFILLAITILFLIPRTSIVGLILLTGYLGGAIATMARVGEPFYFPLILSMLLWISAYIRNEKIKSLLL